MTTKTKHKASVPKPPPPTPKPPPPPPPAAAPLSYEEPLLAKTAPPLMTPLKVISDCAGPGASGRVGLELAARILTELEAHGYKIGDIEVPF